MNTRRLGNSDLEITPIGVGAWAIGGGGWQYAWGAQDDNQSIAAIHRALEHGINWIDTAAVYGTGHSEDIVANALKQWKGKRPHVFTKCGLVWDGTRKVRQDITPASIFQECEDSLRRLQTDVIDLYQIHWPSDNLKDVEAAWGAMVKLKQQGKVRWIGVSNFNAEQLAHCHKIEPITSIQPPYSLINRTIEAAELPFCLQNNIGTLVYSPMASGLLSGTMTKERTQNFAADDWRGKSPEFIEPKLSRNLALVEILRRIGARSGHSAGEAAIAWTLRNPAVTAAIVGVRSPQQADGIIGAASLELTDADIAEIEGF